jgi:hypothetical protein
MTEIIEKLNIYQKMNRIMEKVKYVQKESKKVNGQYTFVSHDAVTGTVHDPFREEGILVIPTTLERIQEGNRTSVKLEVTFVNIEQPSDRYSVIFWGDGIDPGDKGVGKAVSYAFKYAILKALCLETGDDPEQDVDVKFDPYAVEKMKKEQEEKKFVEDSLKTLKTVHKEDYKEILDYLDAYLKACKPITMYEALKKYMVKDSALYSHMCVWKEKQAA